ncbi:MAG: ABC transporter ATP-binding protein [Anaerolineae bacterium]
MSAPILQVSHLTKRFGSLVALNDVNLEIREGEILGVIGPNGAGKTTLFFNIIGLQKPDEGRILFRGADITGKPPHAICDLGITCTFQIPRAFAGMAVEEAVRVGAYKRYRGREVMRKVDEALQICGLEEHAHQPCSEIGLALLRRVELARALATEPVILLLDETGAGLNPTELTGLMEILRHLNEEKQITLCIVEHVMQMVMGLAQRMVVLDYGEVIAEGTPQEISTNPRVIEAYLGKGAVC